MYEQNLNVKNTEDPPNLSTIFPGVYKQNTREVSRWITAVPFTVTLAFLRLQHSPLLLGPAGEGVVPLADTTPPAVEGVGVCPPVERFRGWTTAEVEVSAAVGPLITAD